MAPGMPDCSLLPATAAGSASPVAPARAQCFFCAGFFLVGFGTATLTIGLSAPSVDSLTQPAGAVHAGSGSYDREKKCSARLILAGAFGMGCVKTCAPFATSAMLSSFS